MDDSHFLIANMLKPKVRLGSIKIPIESYLPGKREVTQTILDAERSAIGILTFLLPGDVIYDRDGVRSIITEHKTCQGISEYAIWSLEREGSAWHCLGTGYAYEKRELRPAERERLAAYMKENPGAI